MLQMMRGYSTIKYGEPNNLEDYKSGHCHSSWQGWSQCTESVNPTLSFSSRSVGRCLLMEETTQQCHDMNLVHRCHLLRVQTVASGVHHQHKSQEDVFVRKQICTVESSKSDIGL